MVEDVVENSPAAAAGLKEGELIIGFDGMPLNGVGDLDLRLRKHSGQPIQVTLWSAGGLRTVLLQLGQVAPASEGVPGAGALFYRNPWELADYKDFGYISHAMEQAVRDSVAACQAQQEARRQAACNAWQNSCISALEESHTCPARGPRQRGLATPPRMGVPMPGKFSGIDWSKGYGSNQNQSGSGYAGLMSSWYLTRRDMWVPNAVGGIHTRIEFR